MIVGGGPAGVGAAIAARQQDAAADVVMLTDEGCEPYEKPPLSKAVLTGKATPQDAPIAGPKGLAGFGITLTCRARVREIDRAARDVVTEAGERIAYDALVLATGSNNRILPMFPPGPGIYYLRTEAEALALKAHLDRSKSLLVIGGGLIGLEVAASAAELGIKTTVIEIAPRILARVCDEETSALIHEAPPRARRRCARRHRRRGAAPLSGRRLRDRDQSRRDHHGRSDRGRRRRDAGRMRSRSRRGSTCRTASWSTTMAAPPIRRSSPPATARAFPGRSGPVRLENWRHAQEHGAIAGRNAAGGDVAYNVAPSFWSEQYDLYIQGMGWPAAQPTRAVRRADRAERHDAVRARRRRTSPTPWASTRSATSPWRAG